MAELIAPCVLWQIIELLPELAPAHSLTSRGNSHYHRDRHPEHCLTQALNDCVHHAQPLICLQRLVMIITKTEHGDELVYARLAWYCAKSQQKQKIKKPLKRLFAPTIFQAGRTRLPENGRKPSVAVSS